MNKLMVAIVFGLGVFLMAGCQSYEQDFSVGTDRKVTVESVMLRTEEVDHPDAWRTEYVYAGIKGSNTILIDKRVKTGRSSIWGVDWSSYEPPALSRLEYALESETNITMGALRLRILNASPQRIRFQVESDSEAVRIDR